MLTLKTLTLFAILFIGCSSHESIKIRNRDLTPQATLEGYFNSKEFFTERSPSLVVKGNKEWKLKVLPGRIIKVDEEGVLFDEFPRSHFVNHPAKLYRHDEIVCAIDGNRQLVAGEYPDKYSEFWDIELHIRSVNKPYQKPRKIRLVSGKKFSFTISPGKYVVVKIKFKSHKRRGFTSKWEDESINMPLLGFEIIEGFSNYIGDVYLDYVLPNKSNIYAIPFKWKSRDNYREPISFGKNMPGGPNSSLFVVDDYGIVMEVHTLEMKMNPDFRSSVRLPVRKAPLRRLNEK